MIQRDLCFSYARFRFRVYCCVHEGKWVIIEVLVVRGLFVVCLKDLLEPSMVVENSRFGLIVDTGQVVVRVMSLREYVLFS